MLYLKLIVPFRPIGEINCMGNMIAEPACDLQISPCDDGHPPPPLKQRLKVHKREKFLGSNFEIFTFLLLVMHKQ
jgi:hypothetical protein